MTLSFETPIGDALSPYHYIEFSNKGAFSGLSSQVQTLLLVDFVSSQPTRTPRAPAPSDSQPTIPDTTPLPVGTSFPIGVVLDQSDAMKFALTDNFKDALDAVKKAAPSVRVRLLLLSKTTDLETILPEKQYTQIALLSLTPDLIKAFKVELERRWAEDEQIDGHLFYASAKTITELEAEAASLNSIHISIIPMLGATQKPSVWAASFAALNAQYAISPSSPYQGIKVNGLETEADSYRLKERNRLLKAGISTWKKVGDDIYWDRLVTTYTKNAQGEEDPSYRDLNVKQTLSLLRYDFRVAVSLAFPRSMLAKDDFEYGGDVVTPKVAKLFAIATYRKWQQRKLVQDPDGAFAKNLVVEIDNDEPGKLNFYLPVYVMGQWRVTQTQIAFRI